MGRQLQLRRMAAQYSTLITQQLQILIHQDSVIAILPTVPLFWTSLLFCNDDLRSPSRIKRYPATVNQIRGNNDHGIGQQGATTFSDATIPLVTSRPKHNDKTRIPRSEPVWPRLAARHQPRRHELLRALALDSASKADSSSHYRISAGTSRGNAT